MSKLKIFLADLTHTYKSITNPIMPYGVGLISSYAKKHLGDQIEIKLFKYPEKLYEALNNEKCDVLGCSTYVWNNSLSHWICKEAKLKNPEIITVLGGPNFTKNPNQKIEYFKNNDFIDIRVLLEGEIAFSNILKRILKCGIQNKDKIFSEKIEGSVFPSKNKLDLLEAHTARIQYLDEIPSPYTTGLMDEFFDGKLFPVIQTTRGCPFSCNFCVESAKYYSKIKSFQIQYALDELDYIANKISKTPTVTDLQIADSNYGMYKKDKQISEKILELQKKYNWPQGIHVSTGKHFSNVIETTEMLMDTFDFSMSVQSMNDEVLKEIGRKNISPDKYKVAGEMLRNKGRNTMSELIIPLPKETLKSYLDGIRELMDWKVSRIIVNTPMFLNGTIYADDRDYAKKFNYLSKFRLVSNQFGIYGGKKVFEYEEIGVSTNTMTFKDYLETRKISFLLEILYSSKFLREIEYFVEDYKLEYFDFFYFVYQEIKNAPDNIKSVLESLESDSVVECKETPEELIKYYSKKDNFQKICKGEEGVNVKYKHKALMLCNENIDNWLEFVTECLRKFLISKNIEVGKDFNDIKIFTKAKFNGILDSKKTHLKTNHVFNYDIIKWLNQKTRTARLSEFKNEKNNKVSFFYSKNQIRQRKNLFNEFGSQDAYALSNIIEIIYPPHNVHRKYDYESKII
tara:strand:+ start:16079 stop:18127 length:2049 start_codon:yes stop_codon:yes gene_type:complete